MTFLDELQGSTNRTARTENGALTNKSTLDANLDFFSLAGAMRDNLRDARKLFNHAYYSDAQTAVRTLFYLRDIRGGQGERNLFRELYKEFSLIDPTNARHLLDLIPVYGRWDDLFEVASVEEYAPIVRSQLESDKSASENASSSKSRAVARQLASALGLTNREYRQTLATLRSRIRLLETQMSEGSWDTIDYSKIPSQAGRKHNKAFRRHDEDRYSAFLDRATTGEVKMNTSTLYTYEVVSKLRSDPSVADAMWANLHDYTNGKNALVVADVSGSMGSFGYGDSPVNVSTSLALYFAEHNTGPFHGHFMTFSERPELVKINDGSTLSQKFGVINRGEWGMNTNVEAMFNAVLDAAKRSNASQEEIPAVIYIISDMEFDPVGLYSYAGASNAELTNFENAEKRFEAAGYKLPHLVYWNVNARNTNAPATARDGRVTLISGLSQSTFRYAVEGKTPLELMNSVVNSERYQPIVLESLSNEVFRDRFTPRGSIGGRIWSEDHPSDSTYDW